MPQPDPPCVGVRCVSPRHCAGFGCWLAAINPSLAAVPPHWEQPCFRGACKRPGRCKVHHCEAAYWQAVREPPDASAAPAAAAEERAGPRPSIADDPGNWFDGLKRR